MANTRIRIKLKAYEHNLIDQSAEKSFAHPTSTRTQENSLKCAPTSA